MSVTYSADEFPESAADFTAVADALVSGANGTSEDSPILEGKRNAALTIVAGRMRHIGASRSMIQVALLEMNRLRCNPELDVAEVKKIAKSVARYKPDEAWKAITSGQFRKQWLDGTFDSDEDKVEALVPVSARCLIMTHKALRRAIIHDLLREGETMNFIAASKVGKSWAVLDLAIALVLGRPWLGMFHTEPGHVLLIDNELHPETTANRIPRVAEARGAKLEEYADKFDVINLRGRLKDIHGLGTFLRSLEPGKYRVIILDAFYRFIPAETDENDNGSMARLYNTIDSHALRLGCAFILVHHASKGEQGGKSVTDVGAGAGAQSRAADAHVVLRPHKEDGVVVFDAAVRSFPPITPRCLRWNFPVWNEDDSLDPTELRTNHRTRAKANPPPAVISVEAPKWTTEAFVERFLGPTPKSTSVILAVVKEVKGLSQTEAERHLAVAVDRNLAFRTRDGGNSKPFMYSTVRPLEGGSLDPK